MDTTVAPAPVQGKHARYYYAHKNELAFQERIRDAKHRYYEKNKDRIIQKALARYYKIKETITNAVNQIPEPAV